MLHYHLFTCCTDLHCYYTIHYNAFPSATLPLFQSCMLVMIASSYINLETGSSFQWTLSKQKDHWSFHILHGWPIKMGATIAVKIHPTHPDQWQVKLTWTQEARSRRPWSHHGFHEGLASWAACYHRFPGALVHDLSHLHARSVEADLFCLQNNQNLQTPH